VLLGSVVSLVGVLIEVLGTDDLVSPSNSTLVEETVLAGKGAIDVSVVPLRSAADSVPI